MRTTNENGILNNYATEPKLYFAEYPSPEQQSRYALQGAAAVLLVTSLLLIAFAALNHGLLSKSQFFELPHPGWFFRILR